MSVRMKQRYASSRRADDRLAAHVEGRVDDAPGSPCGGRTPRSGRRTRRSARGRPSGRAPSRRRASPPGSTGRRCIVLAAPARRAACTGSRGRGRTSPRHFSSSTAGANGRKLSRNLIFRLTRFQFSGLRASARMLRRRARAGPNSMRPWNQPTTVCSSASSRAVSRSISSRESVVVAARLRSSRKLLDLVVGELGPQIGVIHT